MTHQYKPDVPDRSNSELEHALRDALRPVAPPADFEKRVMSAIEAASRKETHYRCDENGQGVYAPRSPRLRWVLASVAAAAATVVITMGIRSHREPVRGARANQVSGQVLLALRITNDQLASAFKLVDDELSTDHSSRTRGHQGD